MTLIYSEWLAILLFIVVSIGLSGVLFGLSYAFIHQNPDLEKKQSLFELGTLSGFFGIWFCLSKTILFVKIFFLCLLYYKF